MAKVLLNRISEMTNGIPAWIVATDLLSQGKKDFYVYAWKKNKEFLRYSPEQYLKMKDIREYTIGLYDFISFEDFGRTFISESYLLINMLDDFYEHKISDERIIELLKEMPKNFKHEYEVVNVPEGEKYRIRENYSGTEYVEIYRETDWKTA